LFTVAAGLCLAAVVLARHFTENIGRPRDPMNFTERPRGRTSVLLDGAIAAELQRRGMSSPSTSGRFA
jgi:hypothetical protein